MERLAILTSQASTLSDELLYTPTTETDDEAKLSKLSEVTKSAANLASTQADALKDLRDTISRQTDMLKAAALDHVSEGLWTKEAKQKLFDPEERFSALRKPSPLRRLSPAALGTSSTSLSGSDPMAALVQKVPFRRENSPEPLGGRPSWEIDYNELVLSLGEFIGEGAYAEVFTGFWKGEHVAIKRFRPFTRKTDETSIRAEIEILHELSHPNILKFVGACLRLPHICLVTEYCGMGSLRHILANASLDLNWALRLRIARDIASALQYLHTRNPKIIHRDIKSSNVLVDDQWNVKVCDFGLAKLKSEARETFLRESVDEKGCLRPPRTGTSFKLSSAPLTRWVGTSAWMSPEIQSGKPYNESTDIYSYAILLWELLTREFPWKEKDDAAIGEAVKLGYRPDIPKENFAPIGFTGLIERCWGQRPHDRPPVAQIISTLELMMQNCKEAPLLSYRPSGALRTSSHPPERPT